MSEWHATVNSVADNVNSVVTVDSVVGFPAEQKETLEMVENRKFL